MISKSLFSSKTDMWSTPQDFFNKLNIEFRFNLDPCATSENHKCDKYYTSLEDGLRQNWGVVQRFFAILLMVGKFMNGLKSVITKVRNKTLLLLCLFRLARIQSISMSLYITKRKKLDLFEEDLSLVILKTQPHFLPWL